MNKPAAVGRRVVLCLGLSQLVSWGITYYLIGGFGDVMAADLGWSRDLVYGGFALSLLVMALASSPAGRFIDRCGGRAAMTAGSLLNALGCAALAGCHSLPVYGLAWACLGLGMRLTLYDAAFAALARIDGPRARASMSQITLLGGLASTVFWPLGSMLQADYGWRIALMVYAGCALATIPLHLALPGRAVAAGHAAGDAGASAALAATPCRIAVAGVLYAALMSMTNFLSAGISAHMIGMLAQLGMAASTAVWIAALRGVGQSAARACEVLFGRRLHPLALNLAACSLLPLAFAAAFGGGASRAAAIAFSVLYGACNGILTITRGTLPLVLFDHRGYGAFVGRLIAPGFVLSAAAPLAYALAMDRFGERGGLYLSLGLAVAMLAVALALRLLFGPRA